MNIQDINTLLTTANTAAHAAKNVGGMFMYYDEVIENLVKTVESLKEEVIAHQEEAVAYKEELTLYKSYYPPPPKLCLTEGVSPTPDEPPPPDAFDTIFWCKKGKGKKICEEKLEEILNISKTKAEVCQRISVLEETYFNFNQLKNQEKARILNQYISKNSKFKRFTEGDFKKYWNYTRKRKNKP